MEFISERRARHFGDHGPDAAELRMSERVLGAGLGEELALRIAYALRNDDHAIAESFDRRFDLGEKLRLVERDFGEQNDVRCIPKLRSCEAAGGGNPPRVPTHDFENE